MSIATRINSMENNIRNAYHGLDSIGIDTTNTNKNIENISALLDDFYDSLPKVSGSGTNVNLTPTKVGRITSQINGDTLQNTYEGYNLLGIADGTYTPATGTASLVFKNGIGTLTHSMTNNFGIKVPLIKPIILQANQSYTRVNGINTVYPYLTLYDENNATIDIMVYADNGLKVYTPTEQKEVYYIYFWFTNTQNNIEIKPMMVKGTYTSSTIPEFQKYYGGIKSPNPDYPQPIQSVTGEQNVSVCGKNIFNENTVTFSNGTYDDNGNYQTSTSSWYTSNYYPVKSNTQYILSGTISVNGSPTRIYYYDENKNWISRSASSSTNSITFTTPVNCKYIRIQVNNAITLKTGDVQLEQGSTATTYEAFSGETYDINLGNIELNKIGTYKDYISGTPNNWSTVKAIGKYTFTGNETFTIFSNVGYNANNLFTDYLKSDGLVSILSSKYKGVAQSTSNSGFLTNATNYDYAVMLSSSQTYNSIKFKDTRGLSTSDFVNSIKGDSVIYILATPTTTPITDTTLINDLNNFYYAKSKQGQTNISVDGNLPIILDVSALKGEE